MLTLLFCVAVIWVTIKLCVLGVKAAWGLTKVLCTILFFPAILIGLFLIGFVYIAIPLLLVVGICSLIIGAVTA